MSRPNEGKKIENNCLEEVYLTINGEEKFSREMIILVKVVVDEEDSLMQITLNHLHCILN